MRSSRCSETIGDARISQAYTSRGIVPCAIENKERWTPLQTSRRRNDLQNGACRAKPTLKPCNRYGNTSENRHSGFVSPLGTLQSKLGKKQRRKGKPPRQASLFGQRSKVYRAESRRSVDYLDGQCTRPDRSRSSGRGQHRSPERGRGRRPERSLVRRLANRQRTTGPSVPTLSNRTRTHDDR